jgi:hypothetical protein
VSAGLLYQQFSEELGLLSAGPRELALSSLLGQQPIGPSTPHAAVPLELLSDGPRAIAPSGLLGQQPLRSSNLHVAVDSVLGPVSSTSPTLIQTGNFEASSCAIPPVQVLSSNIKSWKKRARKEVAAGENFAMFVGDDGKRKYDDQSKKIGVRLIRRLVTPSMRTFRRSQGRSQLLGFGGPN